MGILNLIFISLFAATYCQAQMPAELYSRALKIAEAKIRADQANAHLKLSGLTKFNNKKYLNILGHPYKAGDQWQIAAWQILHPVARMEDPGPESGRTSLGPMEIFHYEVIENATGELQLKISCQTGKRTQNIRPLRELEPRLMEAFPPDLPQLEGKLSKNTQEPWQLPVLPQKIRSIARDLGYGSTLEKSVNYENQDFFGRGIRLVWQESKPWPDYLETNSFIAILIKKEYP